MKPLIVANWKCNPVNLKEARQIFDAVKKYPAVICPPFPFIGMLGANGAQDCFWEQSGAYTGEVSPQMLKNLGVEYVILGHSERRRHRGETDELVAKKVKAVLSVGLTPIVCIDSTKQAKKVMTLIENWKSKIENCILAFEPLSAVGTGHPYDVKKAAKILDRIKSAVGKGTLILYGGSVNASNAAAYIKEAGFQGLLIGASSLSPKEFTTICHSVLRNVQHPSLAE